MKQTFVIRDPHAEVYYRGTAIEVQSIKGKKIIGFEQIMHLYLHQDIGITVKTAIRIAQKVPLHFINKRAVVTAEMKL